MRNPKEKGTITVFLSLIGVLFLSLISTAAESARIQGCRAKAAAALDMGMFSVMGAFERELLEHYDVFFMDGAAGSGSYSAERLNDSLKDFMSYNVNPNKGTLFREFDPMGLQLDSAQITGICLATDENGQGFYQQAVGFMRENLGTEIVTELLGLLRKGQTLEEAGELYEKQDKNIAKELTQLEKQQKELEKQREEAAAAGDAQTQETGQLPESQPPPEIPPAKNPLEVVKKLKREGILSLVTGNAGAVSKKTISADRPSKRGCMQGTMPVEKKYSGLSAQIFFQSYLFGHFRLYTDEEKEGALDYGLEYILCGKDSDEQNLKTVVNRLLLLREGANFLYLINDAPSKAAADAMAALLVGAIPVPGLTVVTSYALLLAWAYGESLLDVRELLAGGNVPILKSAQTWRLSLSALPNLMTLLEHTNGSGQEGFSYAEYLTILFLLGGKDRYAMRALDLIEGYMRQRSETAAFRADHAVSGIRAEADFTIPPLFFRISAAFLQTGTASVNYHAQGSYRY